MLLGLHHVTGLAGNAQETLDHYTQERKMRLVKRTVNFDDPGTYHFYYGDESGTPGSILTFFPWPGARPGRAGRGQVAVTSFAALPGSIGFWVARLVTRGVPFQGPMKSAGGELATAFRAPDGTLLEIVAHPSAESRGGWGGAAGIPAEHALRGFHAVTLWEERGEATERLLTDTLGFRAVSEGEGTRRFAAGDGGPGTIVDVRTVGGFLAGVEGAGTVHHVAWRAASDAAELELRRRVQALGIEPTPVIDRQYFNSVYFREPGGVLFEIATDPPGFTVDEPLAELGTALKLPPQYESVRTHIEAALPTIHLPGKPMMATVVDDERRVVSRQ